MKITEKNIAGILSKIIKEELDPEYAAKEKKYYDFITANLGPSDIEPLINDAADSYYENGKQVTDDENGVYWQKPDMNDLHDDIIEHADGLSEQLLEKYPGGVPEEDESIFHTVVGEVISKYLDTPQAQEDLKWAIENAHESAADSAYISKHGLDAYYGVKGMFGGKR